MMKDRKRQRKRRKSATGTRLLMLASRVMHRIPLRAALAIGRALGWLAPRISHRHYRRIYQDIELAFGNQMSAQEIERTAYQAYLRLGESIAEFLRMPYLSAAEIRRWVTLEGTEHLDAALAKGKGAILLTGHIGNWEMLATVMGPQSYDITAIARPQADTTVTDLFNRIREAHGLKVIGMDEVRECIRILKHNNCLGIVGDVNANIPGAFVQFFGHPAATYTGAAYLAQLTGAEILPLFDERLPDNRHRVRICPPIPLVHTGDRQHDLLINTMRTQFVLQQEIRRRPTDWFWLLQRWKTRPDNIPNPERIPMEHRDLTPAEAQEALAPVLQRIG